MPSKEYEAFKQKTLESKKMKETVESAALVLKEGNEKLFQLMDAQRKNILHIEKSKENPLSPYKSVTPRGADVSNCMTASFHKSCNDNLKMRRNSKVVNSYLNNDIGHGLDILGSLERRKSVLEDPDQFTTSIETDPTK